MWPAFYVMCISMWRTIYVTYIQWNVNSMWRTFNVTCIPCDVNWMWRTFHVTYIKCEVHQISRVFYVTYIQCDLHVMSHTFDVTCIKRDGNSTWRSRSSCQRLKFCKDALAVEKWSFSGWCELAVCTQVVVSANNSVCVCACMCLCAWAYICIYIFMHIVLPHLTHAQHFLSLRAHAGFK